MECLFDVYVYVLSHRKRNQIMAVGWLVRVWLLIISANLALSRKCPCSNPSLCHTITRPPGKEFLMWSTKPDVWRHFNWSKITTIAMFRKWDDELFCYAHSKGVRVVLLSNFPLDKLNSSVVRDDWIKNKTAEAIENFADGINFDIEGPVPKDSKSVTLLSKLVKLTSESFHENIPGSQVSFDVAWSPECIDGRCYDYKAIADAVDFIVIMAYDEQSQIKEGPCIAKPNSPYAQTMEGVEQYRKLNISNDKIVLGLPWYGYDYECVNVDEAQGICYIKEVPFRGVNCSDAAGTQIDYATIQDLLKTRTDTGRQWNKEYLSPFFWYSDHDDVTHQVWYDDPASLSIKYRYASEYAKLKGIAIWNPDLLDYGEISRAHIETKLMWDTLNHFPGVQCMHFPC